MDYSYNGLIGRAPAPAPDGSAPTPPRLSVTGHGAQNYYPDEVDHTDALTMVTHWDSSPSVWFLVLLFAAAALAKAGRFIT